MCGSNYIGLRHLFFYKGKYSKLVYSRAAVNINYTSSILILISILFLFSGCTRNNLVKNLSAEERAQIKSLKLEIENKMLPSLHEPYVLGREVKKQVGPNMTKTTMVWDVVGYNGTLEQYKTEQEGMESFVLRLLSQVPMETRKGIKDNARKCIHNLANSRGNLRIDNDNGTHTFGIYVFYKVKPEIMYLGMNVYVKQQDNTMYFKSYYTDEWNKTDLQNNEPSIDERVNEFICTSIKNSWKDISGA